MSRNRLIIIFVLLAVLMAVLIAVISLVSRATREYQANLPTVTPR